MIVITSELAKKYTVTSTPGSLPRVGDLFAYRNEEVVKSELVIFIRPIVVSNPSLDSDALKHLRKLLPEVDKTGEHP